MNWTTFKNLFAKALATIEFQEIHSAWQGSGVRTAFYDKLIRSTICELSGLELINEFLRVDFVLCRKNRDDSLIPQVWIESENAWWTAEHEIKKLCCLHGPLKILLTVIAWDEEQKWKNDQAGFPEGWLGPQYCLNQWQKVLDAFADEGIFSGQLGVLVGELTPDGRMRFYAVELKPNISPSIKDAEIIWEMNRSQKE